MSGISGSNLLFYGGIALMILSAVLALICIAVFHATGGRIQRKLEREYGRPRHGQQ